MQFTMNGETVTVNSYSEKNGKLVFTLGSILPHQAGDLIDAKLFVSDGNNTAAIASKNGYSVREYCIALLEKCEDEKLVAVANSLLDYASKAQAYLDYNTDRFAAGGTVLDILDDMPDEEAEELLIGNMNADCSISDYKAVFDGNIKLTLTLNIKDVSKVRITADGKTYGAAELISLGDGKYAVEIDGFAPREIEDEIDICVFYNEKQAARLIYGSDSHLYSLIKDKKQIEEDEANYRPVTVTVDEFEYQLFLALYRYSIALNEYVTSVEVSK